MGENKFVPEINPEPPQLTRTALRLLSAIYEKTGGRSRGVRDVAELETGLGTERSRSGWRELLGLGLIERFSQDYAARLSFQGVAFIEHGHLRAGLERMAVQAGSRQSPKVLIVYGNGTAASETLIEFVEDLALDAVVLENQGTLMEQMDRQANVGFAVLLLPDASPQMNVLMDLGYLMGRLGRGHVCAFAVNELVTEPLNLAGLMAEPFDASLAWQAALLRQLGAAGFDIG